MIIWVKKNKMEDTKINRVIVFLVTLFYMTMFMPLLTILEYLNPINGVKKLWKIYFWGLTGWYKK